MELRLVIATDDPADEDPKHRIPLTDAAYSRLVDALTDAGFSIISGPVQN